MKEELDNFCEECKEKYEYIETTTKLDIWNNNRNGIRITIPTIESIKDYTRVKTTWFYTSDEPTLDPFSIR